MRYAILPILLLLSGCHRVHLTSDAEVLDKLNYRGEHRAVYRIGDARCFTNNDQEKFPQADLKCY